jgi:ankyrin repeat protein
LQCELLFKSGDTSQDYSARLRELPSTLHATYDRLILNTDAAQSCDSDRRRFKRVLQWLVAAARPSTAPEINAALEIQEFVPGQRLTAGSNDSEWLVGLCGPLVRAAARDDGHEKTFLLAHLSLKEYLMLERTKTVADTCIREYYVSLETVHNYLAKVSLTYLTAAEFSQPYQDRQELDTKRQKYKLLDYSAMYAGAHTSQLREIDEEMSVLLKAFLVPQLTWKDLGDMEPLAGPEDPLLQSTISITFPFGREWDDVHFEDKSVQYEIIPCQFWNEPRVNRLAWLQIDAILEHGNCISWQQLFRLLNSSARKDHPLNISPLYFASMFGWYEGAKTFAGTHRNRATVSDLNHSLRAAASGGFCDIVKLLCFEKADMKGADVNIVLGQLGNAVQGAADSGHTRTLETLIGQLRATVREEVPYYRPGGTVGSSLEGAAVAGDLETIKILISNGADINVNTGWLGTPLQAAVEAGKHEVAMYLIKEHNFDAHLTGGYYGSALRLICQQSGESCRDLLAAIIGRGGDPSQRLLAYGSLLEIVCHFGIFEKAKQLIDLGAKLDSLSGQLGDAVQAAAISGNTGILQLLFESNEDFGVPDPNTQGVWHWTDHDDCRRGLERLGKCAQLRQGEGFLAYDHSNVTKGFFSPALHAALRESEVDHNKLFLLFENEPTHSKGHLGNPLQAAAFRGHVDAIAVLIAKGADANRKGGFFGTALQAAASQNNIEAVEALMKAGADVNAVSESYYGTALNAASALGLDRVVRKLEEGGSSPFVVDRNGWDANAWNFLNGKPGKSEYIAATGNPKIECPSAWSVNDVSPLLHIKGCEARLLETPSDDEGSLSSTETILTNDAEYNTYLQAMLLDILSDDETPLPSTATILADHPMSPYYNTYFEVKLMDEADDG